MELRLFYSFRVNLKELSDYWQKMGIGHLFFHGKSRKRSLGLTKEYIILKYYN